MLLMVLLGCLLLALTAGIFPLVRLYVDARDALRQARTLESTLTGGIGALSNPDTLASTLREVEILQSDLDAVTGVANLADGSLGRVSPTVRNYTLVLSMADQLAAGASASLQAAQIVAPLIHGGVLSKSSAATLTPASYAHLRSLVLSAESSIAGAAAAYEQIAPGGMPAQLRPGTHLGNLLARLPQAPGMFSQVNTLLDLAPGLLGIGQPAHYLLLALDRSELRPGGGFQGNYGVLTLSGGRESSTQPFALEDTYVIDQAYYKNGGTDPTAMCAAGTPAANSGPQAPSPYWWWPYRCYSATLGWGLRDVNLSPDFPTNARAALQIVAASGVLPAGENISGVIAFTPALIDSLLNLTGPLPMPAYSVNVSADNLEHEIHEFQLGSKQSASSSRKAFTHDLSVALLDRLRQLHGSDLSKLAAIGLNALKSRTVQIYLTDPTAQSQLEKLDGVSGSMASPVDGFYVVDTNDGANKANTYVTEHQTDVVTLLPDGSTLHRLQISVTYDKQGSVYEGATQFEDYSDVQRTYLPGDATLLDFTQPEPLFDNGRCSGLYTPLSDCTTGHRLDRTALLTQSDTPGHQMVLEPFIVPCGAAISPAAYRSTTDYTVCTQAPQAHSKTIYISWRTPHAYTSSASGHGTYTELVQKQPGTTVVGSTGETSQVRLTVFVSTNISTATDDLSYAALVAGARQIYDSPLTTDTSVTYHF